jgi:hypothetical protein
MNELRDTHRTECSSSYKVSVCVHFCQSWNLLKIELPILTFVKIHLSYLWRDGGQMGTQTDMAMKIIAFIATSCEHAQKIFHCLLQFFSCKSTGFLKCKSYAPQLKIVPI